MELRIMERDHREIIARRLSSLLARWRSRRNLLRSLEILGRSFGTRKVFARRRSSDGHLLDSPSRLQELSLAEATHRAGGLRIPSRHRFRVLFVVRPGVADAACMRYRAFNLIEALRLA